MKKKIIVKENGDIRYEYILTPAELDKIKQCNPDYLVGGCESNKTDCPFYEFCSNQDLIAKFSIRDPEEVA